MTDWASYAARWRSRRDYRVAAIIEQHMGERRTFDDQGHHLVASCAWKIPDDRSCSDFSRADLEAYGQPEPVAQLAAMQTESRRAGYERRLADPEHRAKVERRLNEYAGRAA